MGFMKKLVAFLALTMPLSVMSQAVSVDVYNNCPFAVSLGRIGYTDTDAETFDCGSVFDSLILGPGESTFVTPEDTSDGLGTMYTALGLVNSQILWSDGSNHDMKAHDNATDVNCEDYSFFDISQTDGQLFMCSTSTPVIDEEEQEAPYPVPVTVTIVNNCESDMPVAGLYYNYDSESWVFKCDSIHDNFVIPQFSYATVVTGKFGSMYAIGDGSIDNSGILTNDGSEYIHQMPIDGTTTTDSTCDGVTHVDIAPANGGVLFLCSTDPKYVTTPAKK